MREPQTIEGRFRILGEVRKGLTRARGPSVIRTTYLPGGIDWDARLVRVAFALAAIVLVLYARLDPAQRHASQCIADARGGIFDDPACPILHPQEGQTYVSRNGGLARFEGGHFVPVPEYPARTSP